MIKKALNPIFSDLTIADVLLIIFFLFLTLVPVVAVAALVLLTLNTVISKKSGEAIAKIKSDYVLKIFIGYYFIHVFGMIYTSNLNYGINDLLTKLSFLMVPFFLAGMNVSFTSFERIKTTFILATLLSLLILLSVSTYQYSISHEIDRFFYTHLSHNRHATYLSIYFNVAMLFIQERFFKKEGKSPHVLYALMYFFLFIGILLLSARTATLVAMVSLVLYPILISGKTLFVKRIGMIHLASIIMMSAMLFGSLNYSNRFNQIKQEVEYRETAVPVDSNKQEKPNSTNIRINLWKNSIQLIGRNPVFGVGTGDLKEELVNVYKENNYEYGIRDRTSPHNQFLHTGVILGSIGIVCLSIFLFLPFFLAIKYRDWLYVMFLFIVIINCITESILEREAGIMFFTTLNTLFYLRMRSENPIIS